MVVPPKHPKMVIFSTILGNPHKSVRYLEIFSILALEVMPKHGQLEVQ